MSTSTKKKRKMPSSTVFLAVVTGICALSVFCALFIQEARRPPRTPTPTIDTHADLEPYPAFVAMVTDGLGDSNRGVERVTSVDWSEEYAELSVEWKVNEDLSDLRNMKTNAQKDIAAILRAVSHTILPYDDLHLYGTFSIGLEEEPTLIWAKYSSDIIDDLEFGSFLYEDVLKYADAYNVDPAFE